MPQKILSLLLAMLALGFGSLAMAQADERLYERIVQSSTEVRTMECVQVNGVSLVNGRNEEHGLTAADCSFGGSVNSGSGIGVAIRFNYANKPVRNVRITRAGIHFDYPGGTQTHSEISGACFSAVYTATVDFQDGTTCTVMSTGNPPHSACTETAIRNSSVAASAASYSDILAPGAIVAIFGPNFTSQTAAASSLPLPKELGGVRVYAFFNTPLQRECELFFASPGQVNARLPDDLAYGGAATLAVVNLAEDTLRPTWFYSNRIEPGIFTNGQDGHGPAAGYQVGGTWVFFGTGFNSATSGFLLAQGVRWPASFLGPAPGFVGLTQINVPTNLPHGAQFQICANLPASTEARCSQITYLP